MKEITNYFIFIIILSLLCGCKPSATQNPSFSNVISYSNIITSKEANSIYYQQDINEISVYNKTEKFEVPPNGGLHSKNEPVIKDKKYRGRFCVLTQKINKGGSYPAQPYRLEYRHLNNL